MEVAQTSPAGRSVLALVKQRGETDATELAAALGVTTTAVRRHLDALLAAGLVERRTERRPVGRPVARYAVSAAGDETFPRAYAGLAAALLAAADADGLFGAGTLLERIVDGLAPGLAGGLPVDDVGATATALAAVQDAAGFQAEARPLADGQAMLVENNCPLAAVARDWPAICAAEHAAIDRAVGPGIGVERVQHLLSGDRSCTYLLRSRPA